MPCRLQNDQPLKCCDEGFNNMRLAAIFRLNMRDMPLQKILHQQSFCIPGCASNVYG